MKSLGWFRNSLLVCAILCAGLLALAAGSGCHLYGRHVKESVLRQDLSIMRLAIKNYMEDHQRPPQSLQTLLDEKYLREIPKNPFSEKRDWIPHYVNVDLVGGGTSAVGIDDVYASPPHSDW
jgi:general secretion pathway protein G